MKGYMATSLMDSFEWLNGYKVGFGLHHVDFNNPNQPRTPKFSAHYYYQVMKNNGFPITEDEKTIYGRFPKDFIWSTATASYQVNEAYQTFIRKSFSYTFLYLFPCTFYRLKGGGELMEKVLVYGINLLTLLSKCLMMTTGT